MSRVLIGDFGVIARMGLREVLDAEGVDLVVDESDPVFASEASQPQGVIERLVRVAPDVVVLDLDIESGDDMAEQICRQFPAVKVIACSAAEPLMRVYPPFHHGDYYVSELSASLLAEAVRG